MKKKSDPQLMADIKITVRTTPEQVETVNHVLALARDWIRQNQPNHNQLETHHAAKIETFRMAMVDALIRSAAEPAHGENIDLGA